MNLAIIVFAVAAVCFQSISALSLPADFQKSLGKDEIECTKKIVKVVSGAESADLGDFHDKAEKEKVKALWTEFRNLLKNGNNYTKHFEEGIHDNMDDEGESYLDKEFDEFLQGFKEESNEDDKITSCMLAEYFQFFYDKLKESSEAGRIGDTKTFLAMVKDIMTSVDPEKTNFMDSGSGLFAYFAVVLGALPDFAYSFLTVILYIPDRIIERFVEEFPEALSSFDVKTYLSGLNGEIGNSLREALVDSSSSD